MRKILTFAIVLAVSIASAWAQRFDGRWTGTAQLGAASLRLNFEVDPDGRTGRAQSPDQSAQWDQAKVATHDDGRITFSIAAWGLAYEGKFGDDGTIHGRFTQNGVSYRLDLTRAVGEEPQNYAERWRGVLKAGPATLRINIEMNADGTRGRMQSPYQSPQWMDFSSVAFDSGKLTFEISAIGAKYEGRLDDGAISGTFTQAGASFPLDFTRQAGEPEKLRRPQEPKDMPYNVEQVTFENGGITFAGTLTTPREGASRAVVLVSGSGQQDRDEALAGHRPFLVLADRLTRRGIAVLRYDDRGVGGSGGGESVPTATTYDFAEDVTAAVAFLRNRGMKNAGIVGHSEGGMIALIAAAKGTPDFIVSIAGVGVVGQRLIDSQRAAILRETGVPQELIDSSIALQNRAQEVIFAGGGREDMVAKVGEIFAGTPLAGQEEATVATMGSPWWRCFIEFDPKKFYPKIEVPLLAVGGGKDLQVPAEENLAVIKQGVPHAETKLYPELNHLFQNAATGLLTEYAAIEETFDEEAMNDIANWILTVKL